MFIHHAHSTVMCLIQFVQLGDEFLKSDSSAGHKPEQEDDVSATEESVLHHPEAPREKSKKTSRGGGKQSPDRRVGRLATGAVAKKLAMTFKTQRGEQG